MITVLLTDGEFTGMIRSLRQREDIRIIGFVFSENAAHSALLDRSYIAPAWNSPEYVPFLIDVIKNEDIDYVFPVVTRSLELMASIEDEIRKKTNAVIVTPSYEAVSIANNKAKLYEALKKDPLTACYITEYEVADSIGRLKDKIRVPCVIKPVIGENREGFFRVVSDDTWQKAFLEGRSDGKICPSLLDKMESEHKFVEPRLIMPYLPGKEWDADLLVIEDRIISATVRQNLDMFGGLSACTVTCDEPHILEACRKIVSSLGLNGLCCISFKETKEGDLKLLEINPRAMGSIFISAMGGNNLPLRLLSILCGEDDDMAFRQTPSGIRASLYYDIIRMPEGKVE